LLLRVRSGISDSTGLAARQKWKRLGGFVPDCCPRHLSNAAKQEIFMNQLGKFQLRLLTGPPTSIDFEDDSVALVARLQVKGHVAPDVPIRSEWRDPIALRHSSHVQGSHCHG
jgi:hypothetical protein